MLGDAEARIARMEFEPAEREATVRNPGRALKR
jgi:hypothetical protein